MISKSRWVHFAALVSFVAADAPAQAPELGLWWGSSPAVRLDERLQIEARADGIAIVSVPLGKAPADWGPITVAADGTITFHRAADSRELCTLRRTQYGTYVGSCTGSATRPLTLARSGNPGGFEIPAGDDDLKILARARQILSGPSVWDRSDDRSCSESRAKHAWTLYCALDQASVDVVGTALPLRPVLQEARAAVVEVAHRSFQSALRNFNALESTTYANIVSVFDVTERRLRTMQACTAAHVPDKTGLAPPPGATRPEPRPVWYWSETMGYTVNGQTFILSNLAGPMDQPGRIPDALLAASVAVTRREFGDDPRHPVDVIWTLSNGHRSRFASLCGEAFTYRDASAEAADYFDHLIDRNYFQYLKPPGSR